MIVSQAPAPVTSGLLSRITNLLLVNTSFCNSFGLMNGKLGASLFFFYSQTISQDRDYERLGNIFLDELSQLPIDIDRSFSDGLSGIGYGLTFLNSQKYILEDINSILEDSDPKIFGAVIHCLVGNITVLIGTGHYLISRLRSVKIYSDEYFVFVELLLKVADKLQQFLTTDLQNFKLGSEPHLVYLIQILFFFDGLKRFNIQNNQYEIVKHYIRSNVVAIDLEKTLLEDAYSAAVYIRLTQYLQIAVPSNLKLETSSLDLSDLKSLTKQIKLAMLIESAEEDEKIALMKSLKDFSLPTIQDLSISALDQVFVKLGVISLGLYGLSGIGLLLINSLRRNNSLKDIFSKTAFCP
jgi:hypothetical protein